MSKKSFTTVTIFLLTCIVVLSLVILTGGLDELLGAKEKHVGEGFRNSSSIAKPEMLEESNVLQIPAGSSTFKIALFADLHFGEDGWTTWGPLQDVNSIKVMSKVLDSETPGFVIYLGDVVTANNVMIQNSSLYWDQAISPTRAKGIPWASVFGNHDDAAFEWPNEWFSSPGIPPIHCSANNSSNAGEQACSFRGTPRLKLMEKEITNSLSHSKYGPKDLWPSVSNYVLQISAANDTKTPVAFLYFLDSGGGSYPEVISSTQADWFQKLSEKINPRASVPEIIFWHIPSKAYSKVAPLFGIHYPCVGSINKERVCSQMAEMGIMDRLVSRPSVKAVFTGHDHGNDWCCPYKKLWLCYARHTGYGGYGDWPRGARVLEITAQPFSLKSWIRMENGNVHSQPKKVMSFDDAKQRAVQWKKAIEGLQSRAHQIH